MNRKYFASAILLALSALSATSMLYTLQYAISELCISLKAMLPVTAMMMLVVAGVIYALGQVLGAETRARANVWATACLTGALISILMVVVAQPVLQAIYGERGIIEC